MQLIFKPSGPEHSFKALVKTGYVECHVAGPVEVTPEQAEILLAQNPDNFIAVKAEKEPVSNKSEPKPGKNKAGGGGK